VKSEICGYLLDSQERLLFHETMPLLREGFRRRYQELDLLPEYSRLLFTRWQALLWGGSVLAVLWGVHFILAEWPSWINWTAITVALFFAGFYTWRADHVRLIPRLAVEKATLQITPVTRQIVTMNGTRISEEVLDNRTFIQLAVKCLTEAPVDECEGHLVKVNRWSPTKNDWEPVDFPPALVLGWDNAGGIEKITQHPGAEKPLNVAFIRHSDSQLFPSVSGDIPQQRVINEFRRMPGDREAYQFDVQITCFDRSNNTSVKPVAVLVEVQNTADPSRPSVEVSPRP